MRYGWLRGAFSLTSLVLMAPGAVALLWLVLTGRMRGSVAGVLAPMAWWAGGKLAFVWSGRAAPSPRAVWRALTNPSGAFSFTTAAAAVTVLGVGALVALYLLKRLSGPSRA